MTIPTNLAVVDTETTGMEPTDEVIEVGIINWQMQLESRFSTTRPIPYAASAVHHLTDDDVAGQPLFRDSAPLLRDDLHRAGIQILVAHNAEFDRRMMGQEFEDFVWICTYKCALHAWPDVENHKNETLCYYLKVGARGREMRGTGQAHSALFDANQTFCILQELLKLYSLEQLIQFTTAVKNIVRLPFGKHRGKTWAEIDSGYLAWMTKQADMDEDLKELATRELRRRR